MGVCVCVCVVLYSFITCADYVTTNPSRDTEQFHLPKDPLCYPFTSIPPRQPGQPLVCKWNHTVCTCFSLLALLSQSIINWGGLSKWKFVSHSSGVWESEIKTPTESVSGESPLPGSQTSCCALTWWEGWGSPLGSLLQGP